MTVKNPGPKDELKRSVRELGRTRVEIVPRDSQSVFVYWEVANTGSKGATLTPTFTVQIQRKPDGTTVHSFDTTERLDGRIVDVAAGSKYGAILSMNDGADLVRLARSSSFVGPEASDEETRFSRVEATESKIRTTPAANPNVAPVEFNPKSTDSSNR